MFSRIKGPQKPEKLQRFEKSRRNHVRKMFYDSVGNCGDCKQAISLPKAVYCGLLRAKIDGDVCKDCHYFDLEPSEYKLFKRT